MKICLMVTALMLAAAGTASAQIIGMPVWNDPNAGTGVRISGDIGFPNHGVGTTFAARGNVGLGAMQLGLTAGSHDPDNGGRVSSVGGTVAFRLLGGMALPIGLNAQAGYSTENADQGRFSRLTTAVGLGVKAPVPGLNLQGWLSPGIRFMRQPNGTGGTDTKADFGLAIGATLGLGMMGVHAGIDHENRGGGVQETVLGIGVHLGLSAPIGM